MKEETTNFRYALLFIYSHAGANTICRQALKTAHDRLQSSSRKRSTAHGFNVGKAVILCKVRYELNVSRACKTTYQLHRLTGTALNTKCAAIWCFWEISSSKFWGSACC